MIRNMNNPIHTALLAMALPAALLVAGEPEVLIAKTGAKVPPSLLFVSATRLNALRSAGATALRIGPVPATELLEKAASAKAAFSVEGCTGPIRGDLVGDQPRPSEMALSTFSTEPVSFVGRVEHLTPGWVPIPAADPTGLVETLTRVTVTEVLRDDSKSLYVGSSVFFLQVGGSFVFESVRFCTDDPDTTPLSVGDLVVIAGEFDGLNELHLMTNASMTYLLENGAARPVRPEERGERVSSVPLDEIRQIAHRNGGR